VSLISILEMARLLKIRRERAYQMVRKGILPPGVVIRMGRSLRVDSDKLEEWMAAGGSGQRCVAGRESGARG
jgi:excisionase family DNA binding protein